MGAADIQRAPAKAESSYQICDADVANEVGVERAGMRDACGEIPVPREWREEHPRPVNEAEKREDGVEDFKH